MYSEHEFISFHFYEINPQKHIAEWYNNSIFGFEEIIILEFPCFPSPNTTFVNDWLEMEMGQQNVFLRFPSFLLTMWH